MPVEKTKPRIKSLASGLVALQTISPQRKIYNMQNGGEKNGNSSELGFTQALHPSRFPYLHCTAVKPHEGKC